MKEENEVLAFYEEGAEIGRLERGLGKVEFARTKGILKGLLGKEETVYDIGGGVGIYSAWLAEQGHKVTLLELAPRAVEYALVRQEHHSYRALVGDARKLPMEDQTADTVLLMGPLYHLLEKEDRLLALREAYRVLKPGGKLIAAAISKFSSFGWALSVYGEKNYFLDDPVYRKMLYGELTAGRHIRPKEYPAILAQAYFHTPKELSEELQEAGFAEVELTAVEGLLWVVPELETKWDQADSRTVLLELVQLTEREPSVLGASPHFLGIARKV